MGFNSAFKGLIHWGHSLVVVHRFYTNHVPFFIIMERFILPLKSRVSAMILCLLKSLVLHNFQNLTHFTRNSFFKIFGKHILWTKRLF